MIISASIVLCFSGSNHALLDGEILSELDEQSLENDLGISSKIHRIRLMQIVTGSRSAKDFLT